MRRRRSPSSARTTSRPADPERRARYRGRFAPSPTGPLHFGSLVAALASYADARAAGGQWLVRIEDVDVPRARPGAGDAILRALEHHGFAWDERVVWQSTRAGAYEEALRALVARGAAYGCACTRRELDALPAGPIGERVYPGTCSDGIAPARARRPRAMRVRVPEAPVAFDDRVFGREAQRLRDDVGDFIVRRSDGVFAYQLAVVVDDAAQRISDVVRGADLLASTPRQIFLQHALSLPSPRYLHVPVALDARGTKLSKQTGADPLRGEPLSALAAAWRFLGQQAPPEPLASVDEFWRFASAQWSAARIPRVRGAPAYAADV